MQLNARSRVKGERFGALLFFLVGALTPAVSHSETWISGSTTFESFSACWSYLHVGDDWGCPANYSDQSNGGTVHRCRDYYPNSNCLEFQKFTACCSHTRDGGNCPSGGSSVFPLDEGFENPTGNFNESQDGDKFCNEQPVGTSCEYEVDCEGSECSAEYTGKACNDDPETAVPCEEDDGLSSACAAACEEHGYGSEGCPDNACDSDPQGLSCLNQCSFHNWENCPNFGSSSSSSSTSTSTSSGGTSSSGGPPPHNPTGGGTGVIQPPDTTTGEQEFDFEIDFSPLIDSDLMPDIPAQDQYAPHLEDLTEFDQTISDIPGDDSLVPEPSYDPSFLLPDAIPCQSITLNIFGSTQLVIPGVEGCQRLEVLKTILGYFLYLVAAYTIFGLIIRPVNT